MRRIITGGGEAVEWSCSGCGKNTSVLTRDIDSHVGVRVSCPSCGHIKEIKPLEQRKAAPQHASSSYQKPTNPRFKGVWTVVFWGAVLTLFVAWSIGEYAAYLAALITVAYVFVRVLLNTKAYNKRQEWKKRAAEQSEQEIGQEWKKRAEEYYARNEK